MRLDKERGEREGERAMLRYLSEPVPGFFVLSQDASFIKLFLSNRLLRGTRTTTSACRTAAMTLVVCNRENVTCI